MACIATYMPRPVHTSGDQLDEYIIGMIWDHELLATSGMGAHHAALEREYASILESGGDPWILDAGAHIGAASAWYLERYPGARLSAVEPVLESVEAYVRNVSTAHRDVNVHAAALRPCAGGALSIHVPDGHTSGVQVREESGTLAADGSVCPVTLAELLLAAGSNAVPFLAKIDIEGSERNLFSEHPNTWDRFALVVLEPHAYLFPGTGVARSFLWWCAEYERDVLVRGDCMFSFARRLFL